MNIKMNQMSVINNPYQLPFKKVLCCCSAGILRSPTAAAILSQEPYNFNTRACGVSKEFALIPISDALVAWADEIVCMEHWQQTSIDIIYSNYILSTNKKLICLNIQDNYAYRDVELIRLIKEKYNEQTIRN